MNEAAKAKAKKGKVQRGAAGGQATRQHVLDTAERLFATHGPEAVSIRTIASEANVNLGAVNYHFTSKEKLFEEIFRRRVVPLNDQRLELLDNLLAQSGDKKLPALEMVVEAFVTPPLQLIADASGSGRALVVMQFLSHAFSSPGEAGFLEAYYEPVRTRYIEVLCQLLPHLAIEDVLWRYNYMVGAIIYAMGGPSRMTRLPRGLKRSERVRSGSADDAIRQLTTFAVAGFQAPPCGGPRPVMSKSLEKGPRQTTG